MNWKKSMVDGSASIVGFFLCGFIGYTSLVAQDTLVGWLLIAIAIGNAGILFVIFYRIIKALLFKKTKAGSHSVS